VISATFTRAQAIRAGYTDHEIGVAVRSGRWIRVRRGSYSLAPTGPAVLDAERAHVLRAHHVAAKLGCGSVLSHQSALLLHAVPVWGMPLGTVHVTRFGPSSARTRAGVTSHQRSLTADDVTMVGAVRVTTVARALVDVACLSSSEAAICSMDAALRTARVSTEMLASALERIKGQARAGHARRAVAFADAGSESIGESRMRVAMSELGLPSPILQHQFRGADGRVVGRVDFWWPTERVIAEFDGLVKYRGTLGRPVEVVVAEKLREDELRGLTGAAFVRVVWSDLQSREQLERKLRRALHR
jgi:predicted transcriptional regulator of viral defense system